MTQRTTQQTTKHLLSHVDLYATYPNKDKVTKEEFRLVLKYFHNLLRKKIIYEGKVFALPLHLGMLGVFSRSPTKWRIFDYQYYKETGIKAFRINMHSDALTASVRKITNENIPVKNQNKLVSKAFKFEACRAFNRELAKAIRNENTIGLYTQYELR
jgi:hypothetical protein